MVACIGQQMARKPLLRYFGKRVKRYGLPRIWPQLLTGPISLNWPALAGLFYFWITYLKKRKTRARGPCSGFPKTYGANTGPRSASRMHWLALRWPVGWPSMHWLASRGPWPSMVGIWPSMVGPWPAVFGLRALARVPRFG